MKYRVEHFRDRSGKFRYYLAKDIRFGKKKLKVRKFIGLKKPSFGKIEKLSMKNCLEIETKAIEKLSGLAAQTYSGFMLEADRIEDLEKIRNTYKALQELMAVSELEVIRHDLEVRYVQGTTSIEGNSLTLKETTRLWEEGIIPRGKNLREIHEVENFKKVLGYHEGFNGHINIGSIKKLHRLVMDNIDLEMAGRFRRTDNIGIVGSDVILAPFALIEEELNELVAEYYSNTSSRGIQPFQAAVLFHYYFERVHPFNDGNGRVGREILNYQLQRAKYPPIIITGAQRDRYLDAFDLGDEDRFGEMVELFTQMYIDQWLKRLKNTLKDILGQ